MKNTFIYLLFSVLLVSSCTKTVEPMNSNSSQQLVVTAEIKVGEKEPVILLNSTINNSSGPIEIDELIGVGIFTNNEPEAREFRPDQNDDTVWSANLEIEEGSDYRLFIDASIMNLGTFESFSRVPFSGTLNVNNLSAPNILNGGNGTRSQFKFEFNLTDNDPISTYYHLTPFVLLQDGSKLFLDIGELISNKNAIVDLNHRHGILIDNSLVDEVNDISLFMSLPHDIENLDLNSNFVYFDLKTIPRDYFLYHRSISQNIESGSTVFGVPTVSHTNISGGFGLFATFSTKLDSIVIR